jgi:hypothetical protein
MPADLKKDFTDHVAGTIRAKRARRAASSAELAGSPSLFIDLV